MTETEALALMTPPGRRRPHIGWGQGVLQIHVTRACDKACFGCTQGSQLAGRTEFMSPAHFEQAVQSLGFVAGDGAKVIVPGAYFGVVGTFGGNPALSPHFGAYCEILRSYVPFRQRGLWCNHPKGKGAEMRRTFNPAWSNLNVHLDQQAHDEFRRDWPECHLVGDMTTDSRHAPPFVAMKDVIVDEAERWRLISGCDINRDWSALIGVFRGQLRAWFCELAGAQAMLHQDEPDYPDTGVDPTADYPIDWPVPNIGVLASDASLDTVKWWRLPMERFAAQARKHCHDCGMPLRGYGALATDESGTEQVSATHASIFRPKRKGRAVEMVTTMEQLGIGRLRDTTKYTQNSKV